MKLGENLCTHRIGVYENIDEIDFKQLIDMNNVVLKISNGCHDNIFIKNRSYDEIDNIKKKVEFSFHRDYGLIIPEFFHLYSKKRIILEKIFTPLEDLYEFKIIIINGKIKLIYVKSFSSNSFKLSFYDSKFKLYGHKKLDIIEQINPKLLSKLKRYAIKLSEDFPNFIRVDLYLFRRKIYFSELTFDANEGMPVLQNFNTIREAGKNWKRVD